MNTEDTFVDPLSVSNPIVEVSSCSTVLVKFDCEVDKVTVDGSGTLLFEYMLVMFQAGTSSRKSVVFNEVEKFASAPRCVVASKAIGVVTACEKFVISVALDVFLPLFGPCLLSVSFVVIPS